jgi:hypothetical protein
MPVIIRPHPIEEKQHDLEKIALDARKSDSQTATSDNLDASFREAPMEAESSLSPYPVLPQSKPNPDAKGEICGEQALRLLVPVQNSPRPTPNPTARAAL